MRLRKSNKGIAGFFEELPAILIILVGIGIFLFSIISVFLMYTNARKIEQKFDEIYDLSRTIRAYHKILFNGTFTTTPVATIIDKEKIALLNNNEVLTDIKVSGNRQFHFWVTDKEDPTNAWDFGHKVPGDEIAKLFVETTVVIKINNDVYHVGLLRVALWEGTG